MMDTELKNKVVKESDFKEAVFDVLQTELGKGKTAWYLFQKNIVNLFDQDKKKTQKEMEAQAEQNPARDYDKKFVPALVHGYFEDDAKGIPGSIGNAMRMIGNSQYYKAELFLETQQTPAQIELMDKFGLNQKDVFEKAIANMKDYTPDVQNGKLIPMTQI